MHKWLYRKSQSQSQKKSSCKASFACETMQVLASHFPKSFWHSFFFHYRVECEKNFCSNSAGITWLCEEKSFSLFFILRGSCEIRFLFSLFLWIWLGLSFSIAFASWYNGGLLDCPRGGLFDHVCCALISDWHWRRFAFVDRFICALIPELRHDQHSVLNFNAAIARSLNELHHVCPLSWIDLMRFRAIYEVFLHQTVQDDEDVRRNRADFGRWWCHWIRNQSLRRRNSHSDFWFTHRPACVYRLLDHWLPIRTNRVILKLKIEKRHDIVDLKNSIFVDVVQSKVASSLAANCLLSLALLALLFALFTLLWWDQRERKLANASRVISFHKFTTTAVFVLPWSLQARKINAKNRLNEQKLFNYRSNTAEQRNQDQLHFLELSLQINSNRIWNFCTSSKAFKAKLFIPLADLIENTTCLLVADFFFLAIDGRLFSAFLPPGMFLYS